MSLEALLQENTAAIQRLTEVISDSMSAVDVKPVKGKKALASEVAVPTLPQIQAPVAVAPAMPMFTPPAPPAAPTMPSAPTFVATPTAARTTLPFNDGPSLIQYVLGVYKALGPAKGAGIQGVLTTLGYTNVNDVKPDHYAVFHAQVEALKS